MKIQSMVSEQFREMDLGDRRRNARLEWSVERLCESNGPTLPTKMMSPADSRAFYRLMDCEQLTHAKVVQCARNSTYERMANCKVVLLDSDTTTLDYSGLRANSDLGPVGNGNGRGLLAHNTLAVTPDREPLGLVNQILHTRRPSSRNKSKAQIAADPHRESRLWRDAVADLPAAPDGVLVVDVCDRGADVTEFLAFERDHNRNFLVRSTHNRKVRLPQSNKASQADQPAYRERKLHDHVRSLAPAETSQRQITVPVLKGSRQVSTRQAKLSVAWSPMQIIPPQQPRGDHDQQLIDIFAVRVWEPDPPQGQDPVEWNLLTTVPVHAVKDAWERVDWYSCRWVVEELHKGMKTGLGVEKLQFQNRDRLDPAIGLYTMVSVLLLQLREAARRPSNSQLFAVDWLPERWVNLLQAVDQKRRGRLNKSWTIRDFLYALARLGGYQNRKCDGPPGWLTLWRGWSQFQTMLEVTEIYEQ